MAVSNGVIFTDPVFNYSREFPFLWEEITIPVTYGDDRDRVEQILLETARRHGSDADPEATRSLASLRQRYAVAEASLGPAVYWRITDNWLEPTVRLLVPQRGSAASGTG